MGIDWGDKPYRRYTTFFDTFGNIVEVHSLFKLKYLVCSIFYVSFGFQNVYLLVSCISARVKIIIPPTPPPKSKNKQEGLKKGTLKIIIANHYNLFYFDNRCTWTSIRALEGCLFHLKVSVLYRTHAIKCISTWTFGGFATLSALSCVVEPPWVVLYTNLYEV